LISEVDSHLFSGSVVALAVVLAGDCWVWELLGLDRRWATR